MNFFFHFLVHHHNQEPSLRTGTTLENPTEEKEPVNTLPGSFPPLILEEDPMFGTCTFLGQKRPRKRD
jgi:hypothetical protein